MALAVLIIYMFALICIGLWAMHKTKSVGDFFLGGRSIGAWMSAFAYGTTYFSAVLFIGYGGKLGWGFGPYTMWIVAGNTLIGSLLAWWVLGRRTREMTVRLNAMTMPQFLAERYKSPALKVASALIIFVFLVPYSAGVYVGLKHLFKIALGMSEINALLLLAGLTAVYLVLGGYFAVTLTDFLMGLVMILGAAAMLWFLVGGAGGFAQANHMLANIKETAPALQPGPPGSIPGWLTLASLVIVTSLGVWGMPQMVQKFYSIKSADQVKRAMIVATFFAFVITFGAYYTGALTHINIPVHKSALLKVKTSAFEPGGYTPKKELPLKIGNDGKPIIQPSGKPEVDWDKWMPTYLAQRLPGWMMIVIVLLVYSASMSTLSSLVLVSSSAIAMDLYAGVVRPNVERKTVLVLMRILCAVFVVVSLLIALKPPAVIVNLMVVSWGVLAGAFGAAYFYGLFWRRMNAWGAGVGMLVGVCTANVLYWQLGQPGIPLAGAIAILAPFVVAPIASILTRPMPKELIDRAFEQRAASR